MKLLLDQAAGSLTTGMDAIVGEFSSAARAFVRDFQGPLSTRAECLDALRGRRVTVNLPEHNMFHENGTVTEASEKFITVAFGDTFACFPAYPARISSLFGGVIKAEGRQRTWSMATVD